ncbi:hypothetical protein CL3_18390 [butyrate-producing bacterium SM4/1]|nr:hypothetical protein CL3_18390 [butyrate-producing bacterium SM4/1]
MTITGCARDIMERAQKSSRKAAKDRKNKRFNCARLEERKLKCHI